MNLFYSSVIPKEWLGQKKRNNLPILHSATKHSLSFEGLIQLHLHPGELNTKLQCEMSPNLEVAILLGV